MLNKDNCTLNFKMFSVPLTNDNAVREDTALYKIVDILMSWNFICNTRDF